MAIKYQFNKIALQQLTKGLKIRQAALPTLRAKESALRIEVKRLQVRTEQTRALLEKARQEAATPDKLWIEFDTALVAIDQIRTTQGKLAGVFYKALDSITFRPITQSLLEKPRWTMQGVDLLKAVITASIQVYFLEQQTAVFERERKRTTQKLNLFEKVQIPEYENAIRRIKRFLEDEQNLAMAGMKMLKKKKETIAR